MQHDLNRANAGRYEAPGLYPTAVHIGENRRRASPWNIISEAIAARAEDRSPLYPLTLSIYSLATKVLFKKKHRQTRAYRVKYLASVKLKDGTTHLFKA